METISTECYQSMTRYWRRRRYQRLLSGNLGPWTPKAIPNFRWKIVSPSKFLVKFRDMMIRLRSSLRRLNGNGLSMRKKAVAIKQVSLVGSAQDVDIRLVSEIDERLNASQNKRILSVVIGSVVFLAAMMHELQAKGMVLNGR